MLTNVASKWYEKNSQLSLHSTSIMAIATGNKPLLPSREMATSRTPPNGPLRWQPSILKNDLQPLIKPFFIASKHKKNLFKVGYIAMSGLSY